MLQTHSESFKASFVEQAVELMLDKLAAGLLPPNFELLLEKLKEDQGPGTERSAVFEELSEDEKEFLQAYESPSEKKVEKHEEGGILDTTDRFWLQSIDKAAEREQAMLSSMMQLRRIRKLMKRSGVLLRQLGAVLQDQSHPLTTQCSRRLWNLLQISDYSMKTIKSSRKSFQLKKQTMSLLTAAETLRAISNRPTFTTILTSFADTAFTMGLSKSSSSSSKTELINRVKEVTGMEYDRLAGIIQGSTGSMILNNRMKQLFSEVTSPCSRLSAMASEVVGTVCPLHHSASPGSNFTPVLLRLSALAFYALLFVFISQTLSFAFHFGIICFHRYPVSGPRTALSTTSTNHSNKIVSNC